jgi:hypothetical protein
MEALPIAPYLETVFRELRTCEFAKDGTPIVWPTARCTVPFPWGKSRRPPVVGLSETGGFETHTLYI